MTLILDDSRFVAFGEADSHGILYFARIYEWAHEALEKYWQDHPFGWSFWFDNKDFAVPLRNSHCDYLAPLKVGQKYNVSFSVAKLGTSSIQFVFEVRNHDHLFAKVETTHVFVDRKNFTKIPIPAEIRTLFGDQD